MTIIEKESISSAYQELIERLMNAPQVGSTKELTNCCIVVHNPQTKDFYYPYRKISDKYCEEELKWYWSADNSCETIGQCAKMWLRISDDGVTNNSAYGYILIKKYGFNQIEQIIEVLKRDKDSRRAVLNISDPAINRLETKDMQCTIAIQFLVRNDCLEETVYMRSNDVYFGLPYDYIYFISLGEYIAENLGVKLSLYTHHATSMHMYIKDMEKFERHGQISLVDQKVIREKYYEK